jgi:hypothetical protein
MYTGPIALCRFEDDLAQLSVDDAVLTVNWPRQARRGSRPGRSVIMARFAALLAVVLAAQIGGVTPTHASDSGSCAVTITLSFSSPGVKATAASRTMSFGASSLGSTCAGTAVWPSPGGMSGGPSASTSMSCDDIVVGDTGGVTYDGITPAKMSWSYVGTVAGGALVILPDADDVVGIVTGVEAGTSLASCEEGSSITSVTFLGVMTFVRL